jgi:hypothetical protein
VSDDVTASIANDAAKLPAGSAVVVDDFHYAAHAVSGAMTDLIERWPKAVACWQTSACRSSQLT